VEQYQLREVAQYLSKTRFKLSRAEYEYTCDDNYTISEPSSEIRKINI
jgi:hypothetical protein